MTDLIDFKGFKIRKGGGKEFIILDSERIIQTMQFAFNNNFKNIEINEANGSPLNNVNFLKDYKFIEGIAIVNRFDFDFSGIYFLPNLKILRLGDESKDEIDFGRLVNLEECSFSWRNKSKDFINLIHLNYLRIFRYSKNNFDEFRNFDKLRELEVLTSPIKTVQGLENLNLKKLRLGNLTKLESLDGIQGLAPTLDELELDQCRKISSIEPVGDLHNLEILKIIECGDIESVKPVKKLHKLKVFGVGDTVLDGDMSPCIGIKMVAFQNRKHYSHTLQEINKLNGSPASLSEMVLKKLGLFH